MAKRSCPEDEFLDRLPPQVRALDWREREIASVIYLHGGMTSKEIGARVAGRVTNGAIRSMLVRLVGKGILKRRPKGHSKELIYFAAIQTDVLREQALRQLARDYFEGSLLRAASAIVELLQSEDDPRALLHAELTSVSENRAYERAPVHLAA